jgi:hypothetical protein
MERLSAEFKSFLKILKSFLIRNHFVCPLHRIGEIGVIELFSYNKLNVQAMIKAASRLKISFYDLKAFYI